MKLEDIDKWAAPKWYPDFGNPLEQVKMLSSFCKSLIKVKNEWFVTLNHIEDGYLNVDIYDNNNNKLAELYIVDDEEDGEKYGLFYDFKEEKELYFTEINKGIVHLESLSVCR